MSDDKKLEAALARLASNSDHWQIIRQVLLEDIRANEEIIKLIDLLIKENEQKVFNLN